MTQRTSVVIPGLNTEIFVQQHCGQKLPNRQSWVCKPVNVAYHMGQWKDGGSQRMPKWPTTADEKMLSRWIA
jgi:hypothetical protein